jgi:hypothetical protein
MYRIIVLFFAAAAAASPVRGQSADTTVEVLGLRRWTLQMLQDSLNNYAPGTTLKSAACAVILRDSIGFAQAAAETAILDSGVYITLSVVEPQDKGKLKPLRLRDSTVTRAEWQGVISVLRKYPHAFGSLQDYRFFSGKTDDFGGRAADSASIALRDSVRVAASRTRFDDAVRAFTTDRNPDNRVAAALVLGHFSDRPEAWRALMRGLRGPSDYSTMTGVMILRSLARHRPRQIDWRPSESDLKGLMVGTNLFAYQAVLQVLTATQIDPRLGRSLAVHGKHLLLANLQSKNPQRPGPVIGFLKLAGEENHDARERWAEWLRGLSGVLRSNI